MVRRDHADFFCTTAEGMRGKRAGTYRNELRRTFLVYALVPMIFLSLAVYGALVAGWSAMLTRQNTEGGERIAARLSEIIDAYDEATNKGRLEDLTDDIATALRGWSDEVALTMHPLEIEAVRVTDDPDGVSVHGMVTVRAMVERDG